MLSVVKGHAYGNDFLLVPLDAARTFMVRDLARNFCHRHTGIGADGLLLYELTDRGATMALWNADGSPSELSGNGLRCLAALVVRRQDLQPPASVTVSTDAGNKTLELLAREGERCTFRAALGQPADLRQTQIAVLDEVVTASVLAVGN